MYGPSEGQLIGCFLVILGLGVLLGIGGVWLWNHVLCHIKIGWQ